MLDEHKMKKDACECKSSEGLFMPSRQVGLILAALILAGFVLFANCCDHLINPFYINIYNDNTYLILTRYNANIVKLFLIL